MRASERTAVLDANAAHLGVDTAQLMENAGAGVARSVEGHRGGDDVVVLAGRGNNGGDALVAARFLEDLDPTVLLLGRRETVASDLTRRNLDVLVASETEPTEVRDATELPVDAIASADAVVDGMLGTGVAGALREPVRSAVEATNDCDGTVVSVDVPSGADPDVPPGSTDGTVVDADAVVTFHEWKPCHEGLDADVTVVDIGIPDAAWTFVGPGDVALLDRDPASHKGENGTVTVVGGGPYAGAPALAGLAALRAGADLARVVVPERVADAVQGYAPDLIVHDLPGDRLRPEHVDRVRDVVERSDVAVVGPGMSGADETVEAVETLAGDLDRAVLDAEAIGAVDALPRDADAMVTPHAGELAPHVEEVPDGWRERRDVVRGFAADRGVTALLKGRYDVVSDGDDVRVGRTGNPGMTVGGTGDVLAGVCGSLLATREPFHAACVAAHVNGRAGDLAADDAGFGLLASDVVERLPAAISE